MFKIKFFHLFAALQVFAIRYICSCSGQGEGINNHTSLASSDLLNFSAPVSVSSNNHWTKHDVLNKNLDRSNNTQRKLDKLFRVDSRIFEQYLKDVDLTIIPGIRQDDDLDNWIPPREIQRDIPIYISGFDYEDRPIWVLEWGKWRFDKYITRNQTTIALFEKYCRYLAYNAIRSIALRSTKERRVTQFISISDFKGFPPEFLLNRKIIQLQLTVFSNFRRHYEKNAFRAICINVNPVSEIMINLLRPYVGRYLSKIDIYGTNKNIWAPKLLKFFPKDQLPEWYGGNKGALPFLRFG